MPGAISCDRPKPAIVVANGRHDNTVLVFQGNALTSVVERAIPGPKYANRRWQTVRFSKGGGINGCNHNALERMENTRPGVGSGKRREVEMHTVSKSPLRDVEWRRRDVRNFDELRKLAGRMVLNFADEDLLRSSAVGQSANTVQEDRKPNDSSHGLGD